MASVNKNQTDAIIALQEALSVAAKPCFLYFMTISDDDNSILTLSYKYGDVATTADLQTLSPPNEKGVENSINDKIHDELKKLYKKLKSAGPTPVAASTSLTPNADKILKLYETGGSKETQLTTAVTDINDWIAPNVLKTSDNSIATDQLSLLELKTLLELPDNEQFLAVAAAAAAAGGKPFIGGSRFRSMKNRRRHKRKHNTKRRNRK